MLIYIKNHMPYLFVITGEFNTRSSSGWSNDINIIGGIKLFWGTSSDEFQKQIN